MSGAVSNIPRIKITHNLPSAFDSDSKDQEIPCSS
jgi:hypothetical protein